MSRTAHLLFVAALLHGALVASAAPSSPSPRRAHLYRGELPGAPPREAPRRIVSLAPVLTESLFALGVGDRVVGVTRYCDRPRAAEELPKVGGFVDPQLEIILGLKPDLVVAMPSFGQRQVLDRLRERGVPVLVAFADDIAEVRDLLRALGGVTQRQEEAARLIAELDAGLASVSSGTRAHRRPRALVVFQVQPLVVAGPGTFADEALRLAGAEPSVPEGAPAWPTWSLEALLAASPDVIVAAEGPEAAERLRRALRALGARGARFVVTAHDRPILMRPGPTLHDDVAVLARLVTSSVPSTAAP